MSISYLIVIVGVLLIPFSIIVLLVSPKKNKQISCQYCNSQLTNGTAYCPNCGQYIEKRN